MIIRPLIILHRYVGVVLGVLMTVWCLSGFVMMYQPYPATSAAERQAGLEHEVRMLAEIVVRGGLPRLPLILELGEMQPGNELPGRSISTPLSVANARSMRPGIDSVCIARSMSTGPSTG